MAARGWDARRYLPIGKFSERATPRSWNSDDSARAEPNKAGRSVQSGGDRNVRRLNYGKDRQRSNGSMQGATAEELSDHAFSVVTGALQGFTVNRGWVG
jgi:hypothetical protein